MLKNSSLSSQLEAHWVLPGWFENSKERPTWNYTTGKKIRQGLFCWKIHFKILQILAVSHHSPKTQKSRCPEVAKAARWLPCTTGSPDVLCRQPKDCWARGKSWGSGTALEIISLLSVSCGFFLFSKKQSCLKIKALKYPGRDGCVASLFRQSHGWLFYNANKVGP